MNMDTNCVEEEKICIMLFLSATKIISNAEILLYLKCAVGFEELKAKHKRQIYYFITYFYLSVYFT